MSLFSYSTISLFVSLGNNLGCGYLSDHKKYLLAQVKVCFLYVISEGRSP